MSSCTHVSGNARSTPSEGTCIQSMRYIACSLTAFTPCKQVKKLATVLTSTESSRRYKGTLVLAEVRTKACSLLPQHGCLYRDLRGLLGMPLLKRVSSYGRCNSPTTSSMQKMLPSEGPRHSYLIFCSWLRWLRKPQMHWHTHNNFITWRSSSAAALLMGEFLKSPASKHMQPVHSVVVA